MEEFDPQVLIVDLNLPDGDGLEVFRAAREAKPDRDGIVLTGQASLDSAVEALRAGVSDYLLKPLRPAQLEVVFQRLSARRSLESEVDTLRAELQETGKLGELIGKSPAMAKVFEAIRRVAVSNAPVLVTGQSGTGKEVVARTIHRLSRRAVGALRRVQLRGDLADAHRERALRPRARLLHRRGQAPRRLLRGGQRRHAPARRDHGDGPRAPGQASPRARGQDPAPRRRSAGSAGRRAAHLRHEPRSPRGDQARTSFAKISTTA